MNEKIDSINTPLSMRVVNVRRICRVLDIVFIIDAALYLIFDLALIKLTGGVDGGPHFFSSSQSSLHTIFLAYWMLHAFIIIGAIVVPFVIVLNSFLVARFVSLKTKLNTYVGTVILSLVLLTGAYFLFHAFLVGYL